MHGWLLGALLCLSLPLSAAERIVSLAPFLTDMVVLLESDAHLVGVLDDSSLPASLSTVPRVGAHQSLSLEQIVAVHPDLVLAWPSGNAPELLSRLESFGIHVARFDPQTLDEIEQMTRDLGDLLGRESQAEALSQAYRSDLLRLQRSPASVAEGAAAPGVFVQLWGEPIFTAAGEQLLSDALQHCGAHNVFESLPGLAPQVSVEAVLAAKPTVIVALADDPERAAGWLKRWRDYPTLPAVKRNQLHALQSDALVRPTPDIVLGLAELCAVIAVSDEPVARGTAD